MPKTDPRLDGYISDAQPFARLILEHIRALVHEACPEVEETIKWNFPHFVLPKGTAWGKGGGTLCSMAAFKEHCALAFWNSEFQPQSPAGVCGVDRGGEA